MTAPEYIALRDEVWQAPDGFVTHIIAAAPLPNGSILVTLGTGFTTLYADLPWHGYVKLQ